MKNTRSDEQVREEPARNSHDQKFTPKIHTQDTDTHQGMNNTLISPVLVHRKFTVGHGRPLQKFTTPTRITCQTEILTGVHDKLLQRNTKPAFFFFATKQAEQHPFFPK